MTIQDVTDALDLPELRAARQARREFLDRLEPLRSDLYAYCRRLTGNAFDAEDLVQESLARAFTQAAQAHSPIANPRAWLFRVATNAYVDNYRRQAPVLVDALEQVAPATADPAEVRDAWAELVTLLPPQERAALALKDLFGFTLAEVADVLRTSVGAVKAALHRGRGRLDSPERDRSLKARQAPDRRLLDAVAEAFTAYDVPRLTALLLADADSEILGVLTEWGADQMRNGSIEHTLDHSKPYRYTAEVVELWDETVLVVRIVRDGKTAVNDLMRLTTEDGKVRTIRWYYFSPDFLAEAAAALGEPVELNGYHY
ncbi:RNA polymerase sigma-70 factor (ECF subfamily) [Kribbella steppae]|uniref:RNA polymerase sigma factor n=1 Tax=Kribbella steppae TaxID=2512223 RepID=A0A4R2HSE7_9ACTN|nr:RNA polymerase sigma-70 factor (ECF subfamily) [Kribbella steppae]